MKNIYIVAILTALILTSCRQQQKEESLSSSSETLVDTTAGSCPYLTNDSKGNIILSWIKKVDTSTSVFCYAVSNDAGKTFSKPIEIPGSTNVHPHAENMPKIIVKASGEIIAVWGALNTNPKNAYSGLVYYSQSLNSGKTWSKPTSLVTDTASYDQRYFDVALLPDGEAAIVWLDNRKSFNNEGSGLYYAVTKGNSGFINERLISGPCCQCCRTNLFIDSKKNIHVLYRAIFNDSIRDMAHIVSTNGGDTFSEAAKISNDNWVITGCPHTGPSMAENNNGIHFTWFTAGSGSGVFYNHSSDDGKTFSARDSVSGKLAKHSQITTLPGGDLLIVWNESFPNGNKFFSRIGIERREADGIRSLKQYITAENGSASFPVIKAINENTAIIAYTQNVGDKDHVAYQTVVFR